MGWSGAGLNPFVCLGAGPRIPSSLQFSHAQAQIGLSSRESQIYEALKAVHFHLLCASSSCLILVRSSFLIHASFQPPSHDFLHVGVDHSGSQRGDPCPSKSSLQNPHGHRHPLVQGYAISLHGIKSYELPYLIFM